MRYFKNLLNIAPRIIFWNKSRRATPSLGNTGTRNKNDWEPLF
jgi:hypothetical protein